MKHTRFNRIVKREINRMTGVPVRDMGHVEITPYDLIVDVRNPHPYYPGDITTVSIPRFSYYPNGEKFPVWQTVEVVR